MKAFISIIFVLILSSTFGQNNVIDFVSDDVCKCIMLAKNLTTDTFRNCLNNSLEKNKDSISKSNIFPNKDASGEAASKLTKQIYSLVSVKMIYSCNPYFNLIDTSRYFEIHRLNQDSIKSEIQNISKIDASKQDKDFFMERGVMYFQISDLDKALVDFDKFLQLYKWSFTTIYFKALTLERKGDYNDAIELYNKLARVTGQNYFNIFAAIATRKKNGL
ncbi:MAG: hypothetical protein ABI675_10915 [Chitinophagaceae bacterium]